MTTLLIRSYQDRDLPALVELINAADKVDDAGFTTTVEAFAHRLAAPDTRAADNVLLAEVNGHLVGYVGFHMRHHDTYHRVVAFGIVHPDWRRQRIGTALMKQVGKRARAFQGSKPLFLDMTARAPVRGAGELALSLGMRPVRHWFWMECHNLDPVGNLPRPAFPDGIRLRTYMASQDKADFVAAYNESFRDHWGSTPLPLKWEMWRQSAPGFQPEDTLLAVGRDGRIVGLCVVLFPEPGGHLLKDGSPIVEDLAVIPGHRRRGIGRALLLAGMQRIRTEGFLEVSLGVDAANPNQAHKLYESVGFKVASRSTTYRKQSV